MASEKKLNRYSASHAVYSLHYHLETLESELRELFEQKTKELNIRIEAMEILPDHVHLSVLASPAITPQLIVNQMKGYSLMCFGSAMIG